MRIARNTPDVLIVSETPWFLGLGLIGFTLVFAAISLSLIGQGEMIGFGFLLGVVVGLGAFAVFVRRIQVVFHRPESWVEIRSRTIMGTRVIRHDLSEISQAIVERSRSDNKMTYRVSLIIPNGQSTGTHPLTPVYSNVGDHHGIAEEINHWLSEARREKPAT